MGEGRLFAFKYNIFIKKNARVCVLFCVQKYERRKTVFTGIAGDMDNCG